MKFDTVPLRDYCSIQGGYAYKSRDLEHSGTNKVIKIKNVRNGFVDYSETEFISDKLSKQTQKWATKCGDILISMTGSGPNAPASVVGRVARVWEGDSVSFINQRIGRIILNTEGAIDLDFIYFFLSLPENQEFLVSNSSGSANQANINGSVIGLLSCPAISYEESTSIADVGRGLEAKIRLNRQTNETLEAMARALFRDWFVDFGPTHRKAAGETDPIKILGGAIPSLEKATPIAALFPDALDEDGLPVGWKAATIADLAELNPQSWTTKAHPTNVKYVDLSNTKWGRIEASTDYEWGEAPSRAKRVLCPMDTIVGTVRPGNGTYALIGQLGLTGSTGFAVLRPKSKIETEFVYLALTSPENIEALANLADGGVYPAINPKVVSETKAAIPQKDLMNEFSATTRPLFAKRHANDSENQTLAQIRDLLLPKLMSGEIRLNTPSEN